MWAVMTSKKAAKSILNPGGFATVEKMVNEITEVKGISREDHNVTLPSTWSNVASRMLTGKALIGVAANANSAHAIFQLAPLLQTKISFNFNQEKEIDLNKQLSKSGKDITRNIAEYSAAFVDNGKNPLAKYININSYTIDVAMSMLLIGIDIPTVSYYLSQPALVDLADKYLSFGANNKAENKALRELSAKYKTNFFKNKQLDSTVNLNDEELREGLTKSNDKFNVDLINSFLVYKRQAKAITNLVNASKISESGAGATNADTLFKLNTIEQAINSELLVGQEFVLNNPNLFSTELNNVMSDTLTTIAKNTDMPDLTSGSFKLLNDFLLEFKSDTGVSAKDLDFMVKNFMDFLATKFIKFDNELIKELPKRLLKISKSNNSAITFEEEPTTGYRNRTIKNASADATIAIAVDFNTAGEKLTKSSVQSQNKKYIPIDANNLEVTKERVDKIVNELNSISKTGIKGINIFSKSDDKLGKRLTNPNWYAKDLMDVEAPYKANASKIKAPQLNSEDALKYDMNLMYKLQVQKFQKNPELIDEINERGGLQFILNSEHIVGVKGSRWEGKGVNSNFIKVLAQSYTTVAKELNKFQDNQFKGITLNIAGNGIYTMKGKYTQQQVDEFTYNLLKGVLNHPELKTKIESIRTGGQTGFDEAGEKLGIKTLILAPKGWTFRNISGQDISNEQQFKSRFSTGGERIDSTFLSRLGVESDVKGRSFIMYNGVNGQDKIIIDRIREDWESLLLSEDSNLRKLATDLIQYAFMMSGFRITPLSFSHLQPVKFYTDSEVGRNLNKYLRSVIKQLEVNSDTDLVANFIDQFTRNHFSNLNYIPAASYGIDDFPNVSSIDYINGKAKDRNALPYIINIERDNYDFFVRGNPVPYIKYDHFGTNYLFKLDEDTIMYGTKGGVKSASYYPVTSLGINKKKGTIRSKFFTEYDIDSRIINSNFGENNKVNKAIDKYKEEFKFVEEAEVIMPPESENFQEIKAWFKINILNLTDVQLDEMTRNNISNLNEIFDMPETPENIGLLHKIKCMS